MKTSRIFLLVLGILVANAVITVGLIYLFYQNYIVPISIAQLSEYLIESNEGVSTKLPIDAPEKRQYIPEMNLSFPYEELSDQLLYSHIKSTDNSPEVTVINHAASSTIYKLRDAETFDQLFKAEADTGDCRRLYVISYQNSLENSFLEMSRYKKLKSVKLDNGKDLHVFKVNKSCEAEAGVSPEIHKQIQKILLSARTY